MAVATPTGVDATAMITPSYVRQMARYNAWQNRSLYGAADALSDAMRRQDMGAFFGSIHNTLNHLLWGDQIWMSRFADTAHPLAKNIADSTGQYPGWDDLKHKRAAFDAIIQTWAETVDDRALSGDLTWFSGAIQRPVTKSVALCVTHMFNHQTHHRGQVHALLTRSGAKPDDTDLFAMPDSGR